jgi:hypothetical protein
VANLVKEAEQLPVWSVLMEQVQRVQENMTTLVREMECVISSIASQIGQSIGSLQDQQLELQKMLMKLDLCVISLPGIFLRSHCRHIFPFSPVYFI